MGLSKRELYKFLRNYSTDTIVVNRLIASSFISLNNYKADNQDLLRKFIISKSDDKEYKKLEEFTQILIKNKLTFDFELLIELFEFVVSPEDKIINGAVYTPRYIRDYIIKKILNGIKVPLDNALFADFSCGCGAFLYSLARAIHDLSNEPYSSIIPRLYGLDITEYSIERTKILLSLLAISEEESIRELEFNLITGNALEFDFKISSQIILDNDGFDGIVGNPPYVCSRNMDNRSRELIKNWSVAQSGHPDLYIPFFQIGYENLNENGMLGYITVNTFLNSINGRALRQYFADNQVGLTVINFGGEQIFKDRNTYTCLCFIEKYKNCISYKEISSSQLGKLLESEFFRFSYSNINSFEGWNLADTMQVNSFIKHIESTGIPFKEKYEVRSGIATLKNDLYKFTPIYEDQDFFILKTKNGKEYPIEKGICRDIINANKVSELISIDSLIEKIIFPYRYSEGRMEVLNEEYIRDLYPYTYRYLLDHKGELSNRDKGKVSYEAWYAYGRRQSIDIKYFKLLYPHICKRPRFIISEDKDLLFYNGFAAISKDIEELQILKRILESEIFIKYITITAKNYSSGYISLSKNYLKNFGIPDITSQDIHKLLNEMNHNEFINNLYKLNGIGSFQ